MKWDIYDVDILSVNSADDIVIGEAGSPTGWVARVSLDELSLTDEERENIAAFIASAETLGAG